MSPDKLATLANTLIDARKAAELVSQPANDGGSCNFDAPAVFGLRLKPHEIDNIKSITGVGLSDFTWFGRKCYWVHTGQFGMGLNNTRTAEAACKVLKERGYDAMMYYQVD